MTRLSFELQFRSANDLVGSSIPVEVRRPNLTLAATSLTSDTIEIEPGHYYVSAKLPAGQELFDNVEVVEGVEARAVLRPEEEDESPHEWQSSQHYFVGQLAGVYDLANRKLKSRGAKSVEARLRSFAGNILKNDYENITPQQWDFAYGDGLAECTVDGKNRIQWVQLLQKNSAVFNMALPTFAGKSCKLVVIRKPDGRFSFDAHLENRIADLLVRYSQKGYQEQASLTGKALDAEELLQGKVDDPISAAVGAYAILRFGQLEYLHEWTENLRNWFKWLPDGAAIRGEHLARRGKHDEALSAFLELSERGLPLLSDGLSYAVDRLRIYAALKQHAVHKQYEAQSLLEKLQPFADCTDFREPFTTFTGLIPHKPDSDLLDEGVLVDNSFDLAKVFLAATEPEQARVDN